MSQIDVLKAQIHRPNASASWGFRLQGGVDYSEPLSIQMITAGSPAAKIGLLPGDEVTEIGDVSTSNLSHAEVVAVVNQYGTTLNLTIERPAGLAIPVPGIPQRPLTCQKFYNQTQLPVSTPQTQHHHPQRQQTKKEIKSYQTYDMSGAGANNRQLRQGNPKGVSYTTAPSSQRYNDDVDTKEDFQQSRTFKHLQNMMESESTPPGCNALPGPRSAEWEKCKESQKDKYGDKRVKVFMPQQYNSPMGLYSPPNVMESFSSQAEGVFEELDRKQQVQNQQLASSAETAVSSQEYQLPPPR